MRLFAPVCVGLWFASVAFGFEFRRVAETHEEMGTFVVCILEEARNHYAFRPPLDWDANYDEQTRTVMLAPKKDPKSWITIRITPSTNSPAAGVRAYVKSAFPQAELGERFTMNSASKEAEALDFTDPSAGTIPVKRRLALLHSPSGTLEFLLSSRMDDFDSAERLFGRLLGSFEFRGPPKPAP